MSGSRERKREERRRRRQRAAERQAQMAARSEAKNEAARQALEPLAQGERPPVVTIGAVISAALALSVMIAYAVGAEVEGERPNVLQVIAPAVLLGMMAWGMWGARYWAVLGFQVVLLFVILISGAGLVAAETIWQALGRLVILAASLTGFYFMVRALARIQMPGPPSGGSSASRPGPQG